MSYRIVRSGEESWEERPNREGEPPRLTADVTTAANLEQSRARVWRYPPHTRGRRHKDLGQEEVFLVLEGTLTMVLGDPPQRFDLESGSVVAVEPGTALQMRNESDAEVRIFAYGAPPITGQVEFVDDVEL
jgi:mannose-6-phosphate isomerase-like protein (cupin superfamily)